MQLQVSHEPATPVKGVVEFLLDHLPRRPYCADDYAGGIYKAPLRRAIEHRHIAFNRDNSIDWLVLDVDRQDAWEAAERSGLPQPNVVSINPANGHGHLAYLLDRPVLRFDESRRKPIEYFAAIQRGMTRRTGADPGFTNVIAKNPAHQAWKSVWHHYRPFGLIELDANLTPGDKRWIRPAEEMGEGRNVWLFQSLRKVAYSEVRRHWGNRVGFEQAIGVIALGLNTELGTPLSAREVGAVARSVAKWVWRHFDQAKFSDIQRARIQRRWEGHEAAERTKPWEGLGISRATYYRQKSRAELADHVQGTVGRVD